MERFVIDNTEFELVRKQFEHSGRWHWGVFHKGQPYLALPPGTENYSKDDAMDTARMMLERGGY